MSLGPWTCATPINSAGETPRKLQTCLCCAPRITSLLRSETFVVGCPPGILKHMWRLIVPTGAAAPRLGEGVREGKIE